MKTYSTLLIFGAFADSLYDRCLPVFLIGILVLFTFLVLRKEKSRGEKPRNQLRNNRDVYK